MHRMTSPRLHFALMYRLDGCDRFLIWFGDDPDGVVLAPDGRVATFANLADVEHFFAQHDLAWEEDRPKRYDFDELARWLEQPAADTVDCPAFLEAWNLLSDVAVSVGLQRLGEDAQDVYDTLFWGCNFPAVTPPGEHFTPTWADEALTDLARVLAKGLLQFRDAVGQGQ